jgi:DNA-binding CsgD family transcriptional regulator
MSFALPDLISAIQNAADVEDLRERLTLRATKHFEAARGALFLYCEIPPELQGRIRESPIFKALIERHAPLHEGKVLAKGQWETFCTRADHGHVLVGPVVQNGELVGSLAFTRHRDAEEFNDQHLTDLSALCLHVSTRLTQIQSQISSPEAQGFKLSGREMQIAQLVTKGLTNQQIAAQLSVSSETIKAALKRIFRKADVHSRAQLVARLPQLSL